MNTIKQISHKTVLLFLLLVGGATACLASPPLVLDIEYGSIVSKWPRNYRTSRALPNAAAAPEHLLGLSSLNASGSAQFTEAQLAYLFDRYKDHHPLFIVDLRKECHGFLDGHPISWYGDKNGETRSLSPAKVVQIERQRIQDLNKMRKVTVYTGKKAEYSNIMAFQLAAEEEALVKQHGFGYVRFYVTDHYYPDDTQIDSFVDFVRQLPTHAWLHFHCRGGLGRTTLFLVMYDILKNHHHLKMSDIIKRQALLRGQDLDKLLPNSRDKARWRTEAKKTKQAFIKTFYRYATDPNGYPHQLWSEWLNQTKSPNR